MYCVIYFVPFYLGLKIIFRFRVEGLGFREYNLSVRSFMHNLFEIEYEKLYVQTILFEMESIDKLFYLI